LASAELAQKDQTSSAEQDISALQEDYNKAKAKHEQLQIDYQAALSKEEKRRQAQTELADSSLVEKEKLLELEATILGTKKLSQISQKTIPAWPAPSNSPDSPNLNS